MTIGETIDILTTLDPDITLLFTLDGMNFATPCPVECCMIELGPLSPYVSETGELVTPEPIPDEIPTRVYALFPHDPNNPHD